MKLPKSKVQQYWDKFSTTGRIEDYLNYKFAKKKEEAYETDYKKPRDYSNN